MKKMISILILTIFIGGILLSSVGCETPSYSRKTGQRTNDGHRGHSH